MEELPCHVTHQQSLKVLQGNMLKPMHACYNIASNVETHAYTLQYFKPHGSVICYIEIDNNIQWKSQTRKMITTKVQVSGKEAAEF